MAIVKKLTSGDFGRFSSRRLQPPPRKKPPHLDGKFSASASAAKSFVECKAARKALPFLVALQLPFLAATCLAFVGSIDGGFSGELPRLLARESASVLLRQTKRKAFANKGRLLHERAPGAIVFSFFLSPALDLRRGGPSFKKPTKENAL